MLLSALLGKLKTSIARVTIGCYYMWQNKPHLRSWYPFQEFPYHLPSHRVLALCGHTID